MVRKRMRRKVVVVKRTREVVTKRPAVVRRLEATKVATRQQGKRRRTSRATGWPSQNSSKGSGLQTSNFMVTLHQHRLKAVFKKYVLILTCFALKRRLGLRERAAKGRRAS